MLPNHIMYYMATSEIIAKVYSNSMLVLLNSRIRFSSVEDDEDHQHCPPPVRSIGGALDALSAQPRGTSAFHFPMPRPQGATVSREEMVFSAPKSWLSLSRTEEATSATTSIDDSRVGDVNSEHGKSEVEVA